MNYPNIVMIEAVGVCNAKCSYCPQGAGKIPSPNKDERFISERVLAKALSLAKKGNQKGIYLHHRGEPLLHPNIGDVISKVREAGFLAYLSTNLSKATDVKIIEIMNAGINQIEIHLSGGLTILPVNLLLKRIHMIRKANWEIRNNSVKIEVNYGLTEHESESSVRQRLSKSKYYDEEMFIRFYQPHNWPQLIEMNDAGIIAEDCEWYKTETCAVLCNGDLVICCLDQKGISKKVNIMDLENLSISQLSKREICRGCVQYNWDMEWLRSDALSIPSSLVNKLKIDPKEA